MKTTQRHLALFATLLTIVALPNKLLAAPEAHAAAVTGTTGTTAGRPINNAVHNEDDVRSIAPAIQNSAATRDLGVGVGKEDTSVNMNKKSEDLFLSLDANPGTNPNIIDGAKINRQALAIPPSKRDVVTTKNLLSRASLNGLAAGKIVSFKEDRNESPLSVCLSIDNNGNTFSLSIKGLSIKLEIAAFTKNLAEEGGKFYPSTAAGTIADRKTISANAAATALKQGKTIIVDNGTKSATLAMSHGNTLTITIAFDGTKQATGLPPIFIPVLTAVAQ